jgi:hypothetical protein
MANVMNTVTCDLFIVLCNEVFGSSGCVAWNGGIISEW